MIAAKLENRRAGIVSNCPDQFAFTGGGEWRTRICRTQSVGTDARTTYGDHAGCGDLHALAATHEDTAVNPIRSERHLYVFRLPTRLVHRTAFDFDPIDFFRTKILQVALVVAVALSV